MTLPHRLSPQEVEGGTDTSISAQSQTHTCYNRGTAINTGAPERKDNENVTHRKLLDSSLLESTKACVQGHGRLFSDSHHFYTL